MKLRPADFRVEWDAIKQGVSEALKYQLEGIRPEDVYFELRAQRAHLLICDEGFVILKEYTNDIGVRDVLVWLAHGIATYSLIEKYGSEMDEIGRQAGASGIRFVSLRPGYEKALPKGWDRLYTVWRRRLV